MTALNPIEDKQADEKLGAYLKRARETRGLSVEELANATKLTVKNIELIENDEWGEFQVEAYVRGYLNSICYKLVLDNKKVLAWYNAALGNSGVNPFAEIGSQGGIAPIDVRETKSRSKALPIAIVFLVIAFAVGSHFLKDIGEAEQAAEAAKPAVVEEPAVEEQSEMPDGAEVVPADSTQESVADSTASDSVVSQAQVDEAVKKSELPASATIFITSSSKTENSEVKPVSNQGKTRLELVASGEMRSWVGLKRSEADDGFLKEANLSKAGTRMVYNATDTLYVIIGEPRAISKMSLNGVDTPLPDMQFGRVTRFYVYDGRVVKGASH